MDFFPLDHWGALNFKCLIVCMSVNAPDEHVHYDLHKQNEDTMLHYITLPLLQGGLKGDIVPKTKHCSSDQNTFLSKLWALLSV